MFSGDASHSRRLFFRPAVGSLPSARHCSHVCGFLKSNWPFLPGRNCVRGMVRSHTWHVNGFAAASLDLCSFTALFVLPPSLPASAPSLPASLPASARSSLERVFAPPRCPCSRPSCPCSRPSCPYSPFISARQAWHLVHAPCGNNLKTKSSRVWTPNSFSNFQ